MLIKVTKKRLNQSHIIEPFGGCITEVSIGVQLKDGKASAVHPNLSQLVAMEKLYVLSETSVSLGEG